jgi:hypothetical protein
MTTKILQCLQFQGVLALVLLLLPCCNDPERNQDQLDPPEDNKPVTGSNHESQGKIRDPEAVDTPTTQADEQAPGLPPRTGGLFSSYKAGGIAGMQQQIDTMGPGLNRRKAIEGLLVEVSNEVPELKESEFTEIIRFIDQLPYAEDKGGFSGSYLGNIVGAQSSESVVDLINSIDSKGLKGSLALALGKALANAEDGDVKAISELMQDSAKTTFLCAWADQVESKAGPSDFDGMLRNIGLAGQDEAVVIDAYVVSLTSKSGPELVQESKTLQNPGLSEKVLIAGYKRWLREDSIKASGDFAQVSNGMSPAVHDQIVEALVMQMQTQGDLESAKQWNETIKDNAVKTRLGLFLEQMETKSVR